MKTHFLPKFFVFTAIILLFALLLSQRGLSALAAEPAQMELITTTVTATVTTTASATPTNTVTPTPTLDPSVTCTNIVPGNFIVTGGDDLQFTLTNNNPYSVTLTHTTLTWTDYYDPDMLVDYFSFWGSQYWPGDSLDSPTSVSSNVEFSAQSSAVWDLDFDGYGNIYGITHTIGPFTVELTFDGYCTKTATIPAVIGKVLHPSPNQVFAHRFQTAFEAGGRDTSAGHFNGAGIERVHIVITSPTGGVVVNWTDTTAPFCVWGTGSPCPTMSETFWNSLPNGDYQMLVWARSATTYSWSPPDVINFSLDRGR